MSNNNVSAAEALALVGLLMDDSDPRELYVTATYGKCMLVFGGERWSARDTDHKWTEHTTLTDALRALGVEVQPQADAPRTVQIGDDDARRYRHALDVEG